MSQSGSSWIIIFMVTVTAGLEAISGWCKLYEADPHSISDPTESRVKYDTSPDMSVFPLDRNELLTVM